MVAVRSDDVMGRELQALLTAHTMRAASHPVWKCFSQGLLLTFSNAVLLTPSITITSILCFTLRGTLTTAETDLCADPM